MDKRSSLAVDVLLLFTEQQKNVCYEDNQERSKTPQIHIN